MAQHEVSGNGLPEKDWFSVQEISERWGCPIEELVHFAETSKLQVCAKLRKVAGTQFEFQTNSSGEDATVEKSRRPDGFTGLYGISGKDIGVLAKDGGVKPTELYEPDQEYTDAEALAELIEKLRQEDGNAYRFICVDEGEPWWIGGDDYWYLGPDGNPPIAWVMPEDLLVTRKERDRFESQHEIAVNDSETSSDQEIIPDCASEDLRLLVEASRQFWCTAEVDKAGTHPRNAEVVAWLKGKGLSQKQAQSGATFIRPKWARRGRPEK
ncbi:hypothetical protein [Thioalkalivibrio sp. ALM2T]|uniref:hypothetical protein n=1 Tax=Thioalkalivibrio sp. ALM2T TaxID=1158184 RepID=UPI0012DD8C29|nr:hypothetical protein [Thioalkalivibrio sp. ALM2T]